ncbi:Lipid A biosynthesis acyltransferase [Vibrio crassostreae]|uniref:lauroyl-Kdo(2)-lipid IV(A) myristoyltransferase n=1 Tax=Vibrio crassostreae TaxID=246167 RepID=UPI0010503583|nr:lauroyl-Kdo(2)-lipid IV(A) myristoyltransferase [Vibrio crassostreae]TCN84387.1 lauroyl-KDO2-lipid IV(A) myristoyltransferase [Vibrio crassostreae]CAK2408380.1 Lipid A biosynthesis acyltransferase [Vibrio crassostreae]CAK2415386.1 Lipid A biosynthesis acyltransferase [Vibrio crassostreae]CAK3606529.1 Lipid A biosynthesis acyltransferase [Vibrio crassostreae]CAK3794141.1 Lipid A biosynthesis acyltransferase [Vibrio crassostreae]
MTTQRNDFDPKAYNPEFEWGFLAPKYWGTWLLIFVGLLLTVFPHKIKLKIATKLARLLIKKPSRTISNAWVNLTLCFPELSIKEREQLLEKTLVTAGTFLLSFASLTLRNQKWLIKNTTINGMEHLQSTLDSGKQAILLVPHTWGIDIPAIFLASQGLPVSAMAKRQRNPVLDWLMHRQRVQYGGRVYERDNGIKPFIKSVRDGYLGYYLPDQDHGREHSIFVDFFNQPKATLPGLGKLSKVSRANIIPVFSVFNAEEGQFIIDIYPAWEDYPTANESIDTRRMNAFIEQAIQKTPEQYMWILKFLNTPKDPNSVYSPYFDSKYWIKGYKR